MGEATAGLSLEQKFSGDNYQRFSKERTTTEFSSQLTAYGDQLVEIATGLFDTNLPFWKPTEKTRLLLTLPPDMAISIKTELGKDPHSIRLRGQYLGKLEDEHLIYMSAFLTQTDINTALNTGLADASHLLTTIHELSHQKHAEIVGQERFGTLLETKLAKTDLDTMTPDHICSIADELKTDNPQNLGLAVTEGFAMLIEMKMIQKMMATEQYKSNIDWHDQIEIMRSGYIKMMRRDAIRSHSHNHEERGQHTVGMSLARDLHGRLGIDEALTFLSKVDLVKCNQMLYIDPQYEPILNEPFLLPQWE